MDSKNKTKQKKGQEKEEERKDRRYDIYVEKDIIINRYKYYFKTQSEP